VKRIVPMPSDAAIIRLASIAVHVEEWLAADKPVGKGANRPQDRQERSAAVERDDIGSARRPRGA